INGSASKFDDELVQELGLAILRGDSLIMDGAHPQISSIIDDWVGATYLGVAADNGPEALNFNPNDYFDLTSLTVDGVRQDYQAPISSTLASFQSGSPAILHGV